MILLRPRPTFKARGARRPTAKITRAERAVNRSTREALTAALAPQLQEVFAAFAAGAGDTVQDRMSRGIRIGSLAAQTKALEENLFVLLERHLQQGIAAGAQIGLRFSGVHGVSVSGDLATATARNLILSADGARRVRQISEQTRLGVQRVVADVFSDRLSPTEAAKKIGSQVGLTNRQVGTLGRFEDRLRAQRLAPITREAFPDTPRGDQLFRQSLQNAELTVTRDVDRRAARMQRDRGLLIVENEIAIGVQEGERAFWDEAIRRGEADPDTLLKRWFTVQDPDVCPICAPMHGQIRKYNEQFSSPVGGVFTSPPAHLRCRCFLEYGPDGNFERANGPPPLPEARNSIDPLTRFDTEEAQELNRAITPLGRNRAYSAAQQAALGDYIGLGYRNINKRLEKRLRGKPIKVTPERLAELVRNTDLIDNAIGRPASLLQEDWVLYRGSKGNAARWNNYEVGTVISDKGFGSWTPDREIALSFSRKREFGTDVQLLEQPVVFRVLAPRGQRALQTGSGESEFLFPRGMEYKIVSVEDDVPFRVFGSPNVVNPDIRNRKIVTIQIID